MSTQYTVSTLAFVAAAVLSAAPAAATYCAQEGHYSAVQTAPFVASAVIVGLLTDSTLEVELGGFKGQSPMVHGLHAGGRFVTHEIGSLGRFRADTHVARGDATCGLNTIGDTAGRWEYILSQDKPYALRVGAGVGWQSEAETAGPSFSVGIEGPDQSGARVAVDLTYDIGMWPSSGARLVRASLGVESTGPGLGVYGRVETAHQTWQTRRNKHSIFVPEAALVLGLRWSD